MLDARNWMLDTTGNLKLETGNFALTFSLGGILVLPQGLLAKGPAENAIHDCIENCF